MLSVEPQGDVAVVHWSDGENRFNETSVGAWHATLDALGGRDGPLAVVATGEGKFFSNGLDLDWMSATGAGNEFLHTVHDLFARVLAFPAYTVAAVGGHAFAGGAMLAVCFDVRIMRADRGWWCLPEVDLGLPLTPAMYATVASALPKPTLAEAALTGRRYTGPEAVEAGIAHEAVAEDRLLARAVELAAAQAGRNRRVIGVHKTQLHAEALAVIAGG